MMLNHGCASPKDVLKLLWICFWMICSQKASGALLLFEGLDAAGTVTEAWMNQISGVPGFPRLENYHEGLDSNDFRVIF